MARHWMILSLAGIICMFMTVTAGAGGLENGYGGVKWGAEVPSHFTVLMEDAYQGQQFTICVNPKGSNSLGGIEFDQVVYRFINGGLAGVSFDKEGAGLDWYKANRPKLEKLFGKPAQIMDNPMMELYQTYWKSSETMGCFEWTEGDEEEGEAESVSLTLSPPMPLMPMM